MTILGLPLEMFLVFVATVIAGSLGAIHFVVVHLLMGKPLSDEGTAAQVSGSPTERAPRSGPGSPSDRKGER